MFETLTELMKAPATHTGAPSSPTVEVGEEHPGAPSSPTATSSLKLGEEHPGAPSSPTAPSSVKVGEAPRDSLPRTNLKVHKARLQDARNIFDLVNSLSGDGTLLRRNYAEICENIRDFTVVERVPSIYSDADPNLDPTHPAAEPEFLGCGALHLYGPHLAEVRSIVVIPAAKGQGAGGALLRALLAESEDHGVLSTCLFTRIPEFFHHYGFRVAERGAMPDKIYKDCQTCPRLYACDEVAMVKGPLPTTAVLGPTRVQQPELVQVQMLPTGTGR